MLSAVVLTKNEEKNIVECLETLKWCDEIVIVDDYSGDKTIEKIQSLKFKVKSYNSKLKIFQRHLDGDFAGQRNFGLEKAKGEWVLFVDADERVTSQLAKEIRGIGNFGEVGGFSIKRRDFLFGKWLKHGETGEIKLLRLARKNAGKWQRPVHETWEINGKVGELTSPLLHYPHPTIKEFLQNINFYSDLNARIFYQQRITNSWWLIIIYPLGKFVQNYLIRLGFLDETAGLVFALMMSFHSFLTRAKLWQLWHCA